MSTETIASSPPPSNGAPSVLSRMYDARVEIILSVLLAVAALASAWCAYQSSAWASMQATYSVEGSRYSTQATRLHDRALQQSVVDVSTFLQFVDAYTTNNTTAVDFLMARFRPEFKVAVDAWLATQPLQNPDAPATPFQMDEYVLAAEVEAEQLSALAAERFELFQQANDNSTRYVALTVLFATVLFFGGIALRTESLIVRRILGISALVLFIYTLVVVISYPKVI
jgi:hypothetical protein